MGKRESTKWIKGLTVPEILVAVAIVSVLAYFSFPRYAEIWKTSKEVAMKQELAAIKQSIYLYVLKNSKYPDSLDELEKKGYLKFSGEAEEKLRIKYIKKSEKGEYLDPFGNPYLYNKKFGSVKSTTPGYDKE